MRIFSIIGISTAITLLSGLAFADDAKKVAAELPAQANSEVTQDQAEAIALKAVAGKVLEVEREKHQGEPVFSFEISGQDGVHEVVIRISDGTVIENKVEGKHDQDRDDEDDDDD